MPNVTNIRRTTLLVALLAGTALMASQAHAAPTIYTNETDFLSAIGSTSLVVESFEGPAFDGNELDFGRVNFSCDNCSAGSSGSYATDGAQSLQVNSGGTFATFRFDAPVNAISFDLSDFGTLGAADLTLEIGGQSYQLLDGFRGATGNRLFFGFADRAEGISGFSLIGGNSGDNAYFDRLRYGSFLATPAVPEPASWAMMIAGFGLVGGALRRSSRPQLFAA